MARDLEIRALGEGDDRLLEPFVLEGDHPAAPLADDVMVVAATSDPFVGGRVPADINPRDQPESLQLLQRADDGCPPGVGQALVDLKRRESAVLRPSSAITCLLPPPLRKPASDKAASARSHVSAVWASGLPQEGAIRTRAERRPEKR